jgi:predicted restriction endonuclease
MAGKPRKPAKRTGSKSARRAAKTRAKPRFSTEIKTPLVSAEDVTATFKSNVTLETYPLIELEVLRRWNYRCAITGKSFRSRRVPHPDLFVTAIRPRENGGPLHASNFLPLTQDARRAFESGLLIIADDFEIWTGLGRIASLIEAVISLEKLHLPANEADWPDLAQIKWHRDQMLGVVTERT